jgi:LemA protein
MLLGLKSLFVLAEGYPDLKADDQFLALQRELALTEDRIAAARRFYNANVRDMRQLCEMFPSSILARMFGFEGGSYFELSREAERVVPAVDI